MTGCTPRQSTKPHFDIAQIGLWYGCNYGGIMTAYALNCALSQLGYSAILLNHSPLTANPVYHDENNISYSFMRRHGIPYSAPLYSDADFMAVNDMADNFVIGSDQVWRWDFSMEKGYVYFLDFVKGDKKKIAYAASFGVSKETRPEANLRKARYYLQRFDAVSVREQSGVDILRDSYHVRGEWMLDPVFLHQGEDYEAIAVPHNVPGEPYLFAYVLDPCLAKDELIRKLAAEKGLIPIIANDGYTATKEGKTDILEPEQWLYLMAHSAFVFTDSFHGVCFSIIFNKDFIAVSPPARGNDRFRSILSLTGLADRLVAEDASSTELARVSCPVDWQSVNAVIGQERERCIRWLRLALEKERSPYCEAMGNMTYELLYAGKGELDREWALNLQVETQLRQFSLRWLPAVIAVKQVVWRLAAWLSVGRFKQSCQSRARYASSALRYLRKRKSDRLV